MILWSGLDARSNERAGLRLRVSHDGGLTYQHQFEPYHPGKNAGYSDMKMIAPDTFAVAWESGFNSSCDMFLYIANMAEVYARGTQH